MTPASATSIGRTLTRLGRLSRGGAAGPPSTTRDEVRRVITAAAQPLTIEQICRATGLHPNTVRPHLDVLLAVGAISREQGPREGRGRPPWLYRAQETAQDRDRRRLENALLTQLREADSPLLAAEAAKRWAEGPGPHPVPADTIDKAVDHAASALRSVGFDVETTPTRDRIDLTTCPYAALVTERPVICDIHAALLHRLLQDSGQPVTLDRLEVRPELGVCTAHLRRPDRQPARTITKRSPA